MYINDLPEVIRSSKCSPYADDSKIFRTILSITDCFTLTNNLNDMSTWSVKWHLRLNLNKCYVISFTRKKQSINHNYSMCGSKFARVNHVKVLGVVLTTNLTI